MVGGQQQRWQLYRGNESARGMLGGSRSALGDIASLGSAASPSATVATGINKRHRAPQGAARRRWRACA